MTTHPSWPASTPHTPAERAVALVDSLDHDAARTMLRVVARYLAETESRVATIPATDSAARAAIQADAWREIFTTVLGPGNP
jgi:hypothetical protein